MGVLVWAINENEKKSDDSLSNENALVWTGERFENASLEKLLYFVFFKMKRGLLKTH